MSDEFDRGDVVQLKSGGPKMTVQGKAGYGSDLICKWFEGTEAKTETFAPESLRRADAEE